MKYEIEHAVQALRPTSDFTVLNGVYAGLVWHDTTTTKPTEEEVNAKIVELDNAEPMRLLRVERDLRLAETDWMALSDSPTMSDEWKTYRQALRDLPSTASPALTELYELNDESVEYPTKPS